MMRDDLVHDIFGGGSLKLLYSSELDAYFPCVGTLLLLLPQT